MNTRYLTFQEVQSKLGGRSRAALYQDLKAGRIPKPLKLGTRVYWPEAELEAALEALRASQ